jgi:hypothetical protein
MSFDFSHRIPSQVIEMKLKTMAMMKPEMIMVD